MDNVTPTATVTYTYGDAGWKDLLTNYNGTPLTYDTIGNPLTYRSGMTMTWQNGRQLATLTKNGATNSYAYDENGIRTRKTANGSTTVYHVVDGVLLGEYSTRGDIVFLYDESGALYGFTRGGTYYSFVFLPLSIVSSLV